MKLVFLMSSADKTDSISEKEVFWLILGHRGIFNTLQTRKNCQGAELRFVEDD